MHSSEREIFRFKMVASFIDDFKAYFKNNDIEQRTVELCQDLDAKSTETVKLFIERYQTFISAYEILGDNFFINPKDYLTNYEKNLHPIPQKYLGKIAGERYEDNVFVNHCGLKFVPKVARDKIKGKDFIDGGAFVGDSALVLSEYHPRNIYCFEPTEKNRKQLYKTLEMNDLRNVSVIDKALGNEEALGVINIAGPGSSLLAKTKKKPQQSTTITTVDNFTEAHNLDLGLIKLDVEGYEFKTIEGAISSIQKYRPILLISLYHSGKDFFEIKPLLTNLDLDYEFKIVKENNTLFYEILLLAYPKPIKK